MSDTPTPSQSAEKAIREALEAGPTPGPWIIATSNSWRRIVTQHRMESVCEPITQNDGHPDLYFRNGGADGPDARLIAACNPEAMTALLDAFTAKDAQLAEMRAEVERLREQEARTARNRDMWKGQCERQAERLTALHIAISDHNKDCARQCNQRKELGATHCPMKGYDRDCGDCPRDGMLHLTQDGSPVEPWMEQEAKYEAEMKSSAALAADGKDGAS